MLAKPDDILAYFDRTADQYFSRDEIRQRLKGGRKLRVKYSVDVTAPMLHIGHAVNLWLMRYLQDRGHTVIFIIDDFTTRVGDLTGRAEARPAISIGEVNSNIDRFIEQAKMVLRFDDPKLIEVRRNSEWYENMSLQELLGLLSMVTHARLLSRDMFQMRVAEGKEIYMHEFIYPILQGHDSVVVRSDMAIIGSDQMFNEMMGRFFQERKGQEAQTVVTTKITPGTDGRAKQSKSAGNYIGLEHSPRDKFGRVMSIPDDMIDTYFRVYTAVPLAEIDSMAAQAAQDPREAKMKLAQAIVARYHGQDKAEEERDWFINTISKGKVPDDIPTLSIVDPDMTVLELVRIARPQKSKGDSRRLITQGGIELNREKLSKPDERITVKTNDILKVGKRSWFRIEVVRLHELATERLSLKIMGSKDIDFVQKNLPSWEMAKYLGKKGVSKKATEEVTRDVFRKIISKPEPKDEWLWKIMQKEDPDKIIGVAHLRSDSARGNENIWFAPQFYEQGLMAEAMDAINEYAFANLGFSGMQFKNAFAFAVAPQELDQLRRRFLMLDPSLRNKDDPAGAWGFTKDGWEYFKEQLRRHGSSDVGLISDDKRANSRFARHAARQNAQMDAQKQELQKKAALLQSQFQAQELQKKEQEELDELKREELKREELKAIPPKPAPPRPQQPEPPRPSPTTRTTK